MTKAFILMSFFIPFCTFAAESSLRPFRFVEAKIIHQIGGLPPEVEISLDIKCNEEVVQVIRHEWTDPKSKKMTIALGALVRENILKGCAGTEKDIRVKAGKAFSGREYELTRIGK